MHIKWKDYCFFVAGEDSNGVTSEQVLSLYRDANQFVLVNLFEYKAHLCETDVM